MKKQTNIKNNWLGLVPLVGILLLWAGLSQSGLVPSFLLPSPLAVARAFIADFPLLMQNAGISLLESFLGLGFGLLAAVILAVLMDASHLLEAMIHPLLLITQTIPTVALAPLLVLWLGYGIFPKIVLIFLTCFFPITIGLLSGFQQADPDAIALLQSMGATKLQIYRHIKFPGALPSFFANLKIATSYAFVGAVIAEWLGGEQGLGVYMTRVRKSFAYDKMFAVIFLIVFITLLLMKLVELIQRKSMPWLETEQ